MKTKNIIKQIGLIVLIICSFTASKAQTLFYNVNTISDSIFGSALLSTPNEKSVYTSDFTNNPLNGSTSTGWRSSLADKVLPKSTGRVLLKLLEPKTGYDIQEFSTQVSFDVTYLVYNPSTDHGTTTNNIITEPVTLDVSYNKKTGLSYKETNIKIIDWVHAIKVSNITVVNPAYVSFLNLELEIEQERYQTYENVSYPTGVTFGSNPITFNLDKSRITIIFESSLVATEYDIEWRYMDRYSADGTTLAHSTYVPTHKDFRFDASRVTTPSTRYTINNIFEVGDIIFRVRPVGYTLNDKGEKIRIEFGWSDIQKITNTYNSGSGNYGEQHLKNLNWQYTAEFAEEGKRKEVVTYYDGTLRARQVVTQVFGNDLSGGNTTTTLVQDKIYDYNGRPAIDVLPTPIASNQLTFYPNLSMFGENTPYAAAHFDEDVETCEAPTEPMSNVSGAANYYSTASTLKDNGSYVSFNNYVPVAGGFPFVQKVYTPDNTGRIAAQSSPGLDHKIGSGHETRFHYLRPTQQELDRLFGTEIGYAEHYQKQVVVDANNQFSISYINPDGKVVATALSGANPNALDEVEGYRSPVFVEADALTEELVQHNENNRVEGTSLVTEFSFVVSEPTQYKFFYSTNPETYQKSLCNNINYCLDCVYDLKLSLVNECGNEQFNGLGTEVKSPYVTLIGNFPQEATSVTCQNNPTVATPLTVDNEGFISVDLEQGVYTLRKELAVNQAALESYKAKALNDLLNNPACSTLNDFKTQARLNLSDVGCEYTCTECYQKLGLVDNPTPTQIQTAKDQFVTNYFGAESYSPEEFDKAIEIFDSYLNNCKEICEPEKVDICATYLDILKGDMRPGGQYAKYKVTANVIEALEVHETNNTIIDNYNILSTNETGGIGFKRDIDDFNDVAVVIDGIEKTISELTTHEFVSNFKEEWLNTLVKRHPEYCYYVKCSTNAAITSFEADMLSTDSYDEAVTQSYLTPPSVTTSSATITSDPIFNASQGACILSSTEMNSRMNNYLEMDQFLRANGVDVLVDVIYNSTSSNYEVKDLASGRLLGTVTNDRDVNNQLLTKQLGVFMSSNNLYYTILVNPKTNTKVGRLRIDVTNKYRYRMTDVPLMQLFCNHLADNQSLAMYRCVQQARVNITSTNYTCNNLKDMYWQSYRALYLANRNYLKEASGINACYCDPATEPNIFNNSVDPFVRKEKRFYPRFSDGNSLYRSSNGTLLDPKALSQIVTGTPSTHITASKTAALDDMDAHCTTTCNGYRLYWEEQLKMCGNLTPTKIEQILDDMVEVCKEGCDQYNPLGASTVAIGVNSALKSFKDVLVAHNVYQQGVCDDLFFSMPLPYNHDYLAYNGPYSDTCSCDNNQFNVYHDGEKDCPITTGTISTNDCSCATNPEIPSTTQKLILITKEVENDRKCKTCIGCLEVAPHFLAFSNQYASLPTNDTAYATLLTSYLNNKLNMNLVFADYAYLIKSCNTANTFEGFKTLFSDVNLTLVNNKLKFLPETKIEQYLMAQSGRHTPVVNLELVDKQEYFKPNQSKRFFNYQDEQSFIEDELGLTASLNPYFVELNSSRTRLQQIYNQMNPEVSAVQGTQSTTTTPEDKCGCDKIFELKKNNPTFSDAQLEQEFSRLYNNGETLQNFKELKELCCLAANGKKITNGDDIEDPGGDFDNDDALDDLPPTIGAGKIPGGAGVFGDPCTLPNLQGFTWTNAMLDALRYNFANSIYKFPGSLRCSGSVEDDPGGGGDFGGGSTVSPDEKMGNVDHCGCIQLKIYKDAYDIANSTQTFEEYVKGQKGFKVPIPNLAAILSLCDEIKGLGNWDSDKAKRLIEQAKAIGYQLPMGLSCPKSSGGGTRPPGGIITPPGVYDPPPTCYVDIALSCSTLKALIVSNFAGEFHPIINRFTFARWQESLLWTNVRQDFLDLFGNYDPECVRRITFTKEASECTASNQVFTVYINPSATNTNIDDWLKYLILDICACVPFNYDPDPTATGRTNCTDCYAGTLLLKSVEDYLNVLSQNAATYANGRVVNRFFGTIPVPVVAGSNDPKQLGNYIFPENSNYTNNASRELSGGYYNEFYKINFASTSSNSNDPQVLRNLELNFTSDHGANMFCFIREFFDIKPICWGNGYSFEAKVRVELYGQNIVNANERFVIRTVRGTLNGTDLPALRKQYPCCIKVCNRPINYLPPVEDPCITQINKEVEANAQLAYNNYIKKQLNEIELGYIQKCLFSVKESLKIKYTPADYHYTLYYYDVAGNLIKTVPPKGVKLLSGTTLTNVYTRRVEIGNGTSTTPIVPAHELTTVYRYNTLNQLIWQSTPDAGESDFYYDDLGRIVFSQNAQQQFVEPNLYSYTKYDELSRIIEVGQVRANSAVSHAIARQPNSVTSLIADGVRSQITRTYYDDAQLYDDEILEQQNLQHRVAKTTYQDIESTLTASNIKHAVYYSYDINGNVNTLARQITSLANYGFEQDVKTLKYNFDLISGKVNWVMYQPEQPDQFIHYYKYDGDNRLTDVYTGARPELLKNDARYLYYLHGPLARVEVGDHLSQGIDYAYTINGWLKAVNGVALTPTRDMGRDGEASNASNLHKYFASDEFGFELGYFASDYSPASTQTEIANFISIKQGSVIAADNRGLFNGNISNMVTAIGQFMQNGAAPLASLYKYDQLNRLKLATYYNNYTKSTNTWNASGNALPDFKNEFTYDPNGNINSQIRNGSSILGIGMDELEYTYKDGTNQLTSVLDAIDATAYADDVDNQLTDNYSYDKIGNLTKDVAEEIEDIKWNVYGKITAINRTAGSSKPNLEFEYTPDGHRAVKIVIPKTGPTEYTYYVRDAQGNVMATYSRKMEKVIDYSSITYSDLNTRLKDQVGAQSFGDFIANLHINKVNNAGFNNHVHASFTGLSNVNSLMVGLNVLPLLNVSASPYRNWLLTALPPNALLQNYYLSSQTFSEGTSENYLNDLCQCNETDFIKVIASNPRFAYVFLRGLCVYDGENSTNYASGAQNMLFGSTICPGDQSLLDQLDITLAGNLQGASTKIGQLETYLNSNFSGQCAVITQVLQYAYNHIVETEDNDALTDFYNLIASVPSYNTTAIIDNHCECGSFDLDALVQEQSLFISFLQALKIRDNSTYNSFCNNLSISNVLDQLANDLSTKSTTDIITELNNVGIESCNTMFNDIMYTLRLTNQTDFDGIISHSGIAPDIELSCIANHQAHSCTGQSSPINTLITQYYSQSQLWNTLLQIEDASHYTQWYYTNSLQSYLPLAAANTITPISSYQQSNNTMYGSNYSQAMANYMQYIHQHFGNTVYNQLTGHYLNVSRMFDDSIKATEFAMYGSSRLGVMRTNIVMAAARFNNPDGTQTFTNTNTTVAAYTNTVAFSRGQKQFELTNHLGNVMAVVTDKKLPDVTYLNNFDAHIDLWNGGWSGAGTGITPATTVSFNHIEVSGNDIRQAKIVTSQNGGGGLKEIQTTIGTTYKFSFSAKLGTAASLTAKAKAKDGTTLYNGTTLTSLSITADGNYVITFTATTTTTQLVLEKVGGQGTSQEFYLDNALVFAAPNGITAPQRFYRAEVLHATDYSPFGAPMPSRSYSYNKRDAVIVGQLAGNMSTTGWQTTYCTSPSSCSTPESSVTLSTTTEGKLRMEATKRYSQMYYTFTTVPGRVYRVKYKLSNSTMALVNTSLFAPVALKELYTTANISTFGIEREIIFTATETTTRFYVTKGWSALATTAPQQVELDYLIVVEMPSQINYISCTSINQNLTMLANAGVNINDSVQVRNYLNSYYNRNYSYAAYSQVLSGCANQTLNYVLALPGIEAEEAKEAYRYGFNGKENINELYNNENVEDYGDRIYDNRIGRWSKVDVLSAFYSGISPYSFALNNPISNSDYEGAFVIDQTLSASQQSLLRMFIRASAKALESPQVRKCFKEHSGLTDEQIDYLFKDGQGPLLTYGKIYSLGKELPNALAQFMPGDNLLSFNDVEGRPLNEKNVTFLADRITISSDAFNEKFLAFSDPRYMKPHHALYMGVTLLHELVHLGDFRVDLLEGNNPILDKFNLEDIVNINSNYPKNSLNQYVKEIEPGMAWEYDLFGGQFSLDAAKALMKGIEGLTSKFVDFVVGAYNRFRSGNEGDHPLLSPRYMCFLKGTKVTLGSGEQKNIELIQVGDIVRSVNLSNLKIQSSEVIKIVSPMHDNLIEVLFSDGTKIVSTDDHAFYVKSKKWCSYRPDLTKNGCGLIAEQLRINDIVYRHKQGRIKAVRVISVKKIIGNYQTFNIYVKSFNHNYLANDIIVYDETTIK